ncbi:MAG: valine--tRNA ligase [Candidatus Izemoplasmatales bacterium]
MIKMNPKYDHHQIESGKYEYWLENDCFDAGDTTKKPFTVVIPPPNITGKLHLGHTWDTTLQDIIIRRKRMQGYDALYLPGMDHAGIATQAKVDQKLRSQGISRYDLGREKYLEVAWSWKAEYADLIRSQWKAIGLSVDYKHERFTLDKGLSEAVNEVFVKLYNDGLIYRGKRIINWDTQAKTALSNIEIEHLDVEGALYYITYPFTDGNGGVTVATTRPETMFGDVAIMVHPDDERYFPVHGKRVYIPTTKRDIPIILDGYVDQTFGTGAVKVTPAHDPNDFEVGKRHHLPMPLCMNEDGTMNEMAKAYIGLDRFVCRQQVLKDLQELGLIVKTEPIVHSVGHSERTGVIIEPRLSKQWFVKMEPLAKYAIANNTAQFIPERFEKIFKNWMENIEDWCISRQLWWGHRIPVWYKDKEIYCGICAPKGEGWIQDEDVLDTWFSSALWPFSTLGWPQKTADFQRYFPTDVLVTGYDIIFFWVSRMIFQSLKFTGVSPFKDCMIHGLIRDNEGKKMSKSLGNGIDPNDIIEQFGADSLRYFISTNSGPGFDLRYEQEKVESSWNFINKLWNISRYVLMSTEDIDVNQLHIDPEMMTSADRWIIGRLNETISQADLFFDKYDFGEAAHCIYNFTWNDFASWYLEMAKLNSDAVMTKATLITVLSAIIKLLHPFMPFVTEDIYQRLPGNEGSIMRALWPSNNGIAFLESERMETLFEIIRRLRQIRNEYSVPYQKGIDVFIKTDSQETACFLNDNRVYIEKFINPQQLIITDNLDPVDQALSIILPQAIVYLPLGSLIDIKAELLRLEQELTRLEKEIKRSEMMMSNQNFLAKAPAEKIADEQKKKADYEENYRQTKVRIEALRQ